MKDKGTVKQYSIKVLILCGLVLLITAGIGAMNLYYFKEVEQSLLEQTKKELKQENDKALSYLNSVVERRFEWLEVVASFCDIPDSSGKENWWEIAIGVKREGYRFGIGDTRGTIYFGNHESIDVSGRRYYKEALQGNKSVSKVLSGDFNEQDGIVLAVPIMREGEVGGVACVEYTIAELGRNLNKTGEGQRGRNIVFTGDGTFVAADQELTAKNTVFEILETMEYRDGQSLEEMKKAVKNGESGFLTYYSGGEKRMVCYQPVGILDWTVASFAAAEGYEGTLQRIRILSARFITGSTALIFAALILIAGILHIRRKEARQAKKDFLTGVYTRETARRLVEQTLNKRGKSGYYACMFLDIDDFKQINDTYGHSRGDEVLAKAGRILRDCTRDEDVIVRFGGDEFCIWLYGRSGRNQPEAIAKRILTEFEQSGNVHLSIGIAMIRKDETDYDTILNRADEALYEAKKKGKNQFSLSL